MPSRRQVIAVGLASFLAWPATAQDARAPASNWIAAADLAGLSPDDVLRRLTGQAGAGESGSRLRTASTDIQVLDAYLNFDAERRSDLGKICRIDVSADETSRLIFVRGRLAGSVSETRRGPPAPRASLFTLPGKDLPSSGDLDLAAARMLRTAPLVGSRLRSACSPQNPGAEDHARERSAGGRLFSKLAPGVRLDAASRAQLDRRADRVQRFAVGDGRYAIYRIWRRPGVLDFKAPWDFVHVGVENGVVLWTAEGLFSGAIDKALRDAGHVLKS